MTDWQDISTAPGDGTHVLLWCRDITVGWYDTGRQDAPDEMGYDAGWWDYFLGIDPGRSIGNPDYMREPSGQPTHWMPLPSPPEISNDDG